MPGLINTVILDLLVTVSEDTATDYKNEDLDNAIHLDGPSGDRYDELMELGDQPHVKDGARVKELANQRYVDGVLDRDTIKPVITHEILEEIDGLLDTYMPEYVDGSKKQLQAILSNKLMELTEEPRYSKLDNKEIAVVLHEIANEIVKL